VEVRESILSDNDHRAGHNRAHFREAGVLAVNLMGSPGSGKTALLEATRRAAPELRLGAVSGDLATENDALRLERAGIPARTITTGTACHLDASMLHHVLHHAGEQSLDVFVIENVGNLVCPAVYDLGQSLNVVALSVTEGPDKPLKYPVMFRAADLVVLTKTDLLPHLPDVDPEEIREALARVMPVPRMLSVSATSGAGVDAWVRWLREAAAFAHDPEGPSAETGLGQAAPGAHSHGAGLAAARED
jgi:hydrogenase nickel incorporation protein HypB